MRRISQSLIAMLAVLTMAPWAAAADVGYIWWEGENPKETNFPAKSSFTPVNDTEKSHLSGGAWLSADGGRLGQPALFAKYEIDVPKAGSYAFWTRKFWKHGPFKWRFDDQPWTVCPWDCPLADSETIRHFLNANWVYLGEANLTAGKHIVHIEGTEFLLEKPKEPETPPSPEYETKQITDWSKVTLPKAPLKAGQTIELTVETKGIPGKYHVISGMVNRAGSDEVLGFLEDARPSPDFEGESKHTFTYKIPHQANLACIQFSVEYLPEGKKNYGDRMPNKGARTPLIPVDPASIHPPVNVSPMCFDCFLLSPVPFVPRGRLKPDEKVDITVPEGWFVFDPEPDVKADALLDLRTVYPNVAGADGWVKRNGKDLIFEKTGKQARFWGVTAGPEDWNQAKSSVDYLAKSLAKRGVNMVRMHFGEFSYDGPCAELDQAQYFMAAMKKQGIYVGMNIFCTACYRVKPRWNLPEFLPGYAPYTELFFYKPLQDRYKSWYKNLLATPNPYAGGLPMGQDPGVAYLEIIDESNYFWGTFQPYRSPPEHLMPILEKRFGNFLVKKYGSLDKLKDVWHAKEVIRGDDFANGRVGLEAGGMLCYRAKFPDSDQRYKDQTQFMTEDLRQFFTEMTEHFHKDLGFGGEVCPSNWIAPEYSVMDPLDKYAYTAGGIVARNNYMGCPHIGNGFSVNKGDKYADLSTLLQPDKMDPLLALQQADYPFFWTEGNWDMPNRFRGEMPALLAGYCSLQGIDGIMLFAVQPNWLAAPRKWPINTPATLGQFPAAALIYRNGYVKESAPAIREALKLKDLYNFKGGALKNSMGLDFVHAGEISREGRAQTEKVNRYDPLTPLVGPVVRAVGDDPGPSTVLADLPRLLDRANKTVTSATGELKLDWGQGLFTINTPCAQASVGFLAKAGAVQLADTAIDEKNEYASVMVVSMDGQPLKTSGKILVQVMSEEKYYGWKTSPTNGSIRDDRTGENVNMGMQQIDDLGGPPILVRKFAGTVTLNRPDAGSLKVTALDANGYELKELPSGKGGALKIELLPDCLYYVIETGANK